MLVLLTVCFLLWHTVTCSGDFRQFQRVPGSKATSDIASLNTRHYEQCVYECARNQGCVTASYMSFEQQCDLSSTDTLTLETGWIAYTRKDINEVNYELVTATKTWLEAENNCWTSKSGTLAHIKTAKQQYIISQLVDNRMAVWLGATDLAEEGVWRWTDNSTLQYSNWEFQEPNNVLDKEHCLVLTQSSGWNDHECYNHKSSVCQYAAQTNLNGNITNIG